MDKESRQWSRWQNSPRFISFYTEDCICFLLCPTGVNLMTFMLLCQLRARDRLERKLYDYLPIESLLPFHFINKAKCILYGQLTVLSVPRQNVNLKSCSLSVYYRSIIMMLLNKFNLWPFDRQMFAILRSKLCIFKAWFVACSLNIISPCWLFLFWVIGWSFRFLFSISLSKKKIIFQVRNTNRIVITYWYKH